MIEEYKEKQKNMSKEEIERSLELLYESFNRKGLISNKECVEGTNMSAEEYEKFLNRAYTI